MTDCKVNVPVPPELFYVVCSTGNYGSGKRYDDLVAAIEYAKTVAIKQSPARGVVLQSMFITDPMTSLVTIHPVRRPLDHNWHQGSL